MRACKCKWYGSSNIQIFIQHEKKILDEMLDAFAPALLLSFPRKKNDTRAVRIFCNASLVASSIFQEKYVSWRLDIRDIFGIGRGASLVKLQKSGLIPYG